MKTTIAAITLGLSSILSADIDVIPRPYSITEAQGKLKIGTEIHVVYKGGGENEFNYLAEALQTRYGITAKASDNAGGIQLVIAKDKEITDLGEEGYVLHVDKNGVVIKSSGKAGIFYGIQSLLQLTPADYTNKGNISIPFVKISDKPRFKWRASQLDVSRHYYDTAFIKRYIDFLAMHKINVFHWHLTDHQGWRAEIKAYPKLTSVGGWRRITDINEFGSKVIKESPEVIKARLIKQGSYKEVDGQAYYGGFYTQEEMKEVVAYAKARHIEVVPEIDLPGHTQAVLAAYPETGCSTMNKREVWTKFGLGDAIVCVSKDETYDLTKAVFDEIAEIFPSKYFHIGADEAHPGIVKHWDHCEYCAKVKKEKGLKDGHAQQNDFVAWMKKYLNKKDKTVIGWGEAFYNGMDKDMMIMSWWGTGAGEKAARHGNPVVMTPWSTTYFNMKVDPNEKGPGVRLSHLPVPMVYNYEPSPMRYTEQMRKNIIGYQTCLWTEFVPSTVDVEFLTLPRLAASSEVAWTEMKQRDLADFKDRLTVHYDRLNSMNVHYFVDPVMESQQTLFNSSIKTAFNTDFPEAKISYKKKGEKDWKSYSQPFVVSENTTFDVLATSKHGIKSMENTIRYQKVDVKPLSEKPANSGLKLTRYKLTKKADNLKQAKKGASSVVSDWKLPADAKGDRFALVYEGAIFLKDGQSYTISHGKVDDVLRVSISGNEIINNKRRKQSARVQFAQGWYPIKVEFYEWGGAEVMELDITSDGKVIDGASILAH